jgi:hypothetical protein
MEKGRGSAAVAGDGQAARKLPPNPYFACLRKISYARIGRSVWEFLRGGRKKQPYRFDELRTGCHLFVTSLASGDHPHVRGVKHSTRQGTLKLRRDLREEPSPRDSGAVSPFSNDERGARGAPVRQNSRILATSAKCRYFRRFQAFASSSLASDADLDCCLVLSVPIR